MKVNDPNLTGATLSQVGGAHAPESVGERGKKVDRTGSGGRDEVSLSSLSAKLRELDTESPERLAHLEKLSAEVQAGRYKVDPLEVSKKIVGDAIKEAK